MKNNEQEKQLPPILLEAIFRGRCVLFIGSGTSVAAGAPTGEELATELAGLYLNGKFSDASLAKIAAYIESKPGLGRRILIEYLTDRLSNLSPTETHLELTKYPWATIFTTNYDTLLDYTFADFSTPTGGLNLSIPELD